MEPLFGGLTSVAGDHAFEPVPDDGFRIAHDAGNQFRAARDIMDQSLNLSRGPDAFVGIAGRVNHFAACAGHEIANLLEGRALLLHGDHFGADRVLGDARGVAHGAEDQLGLALVIGDDLFLDPLMDRALLGAHEARAHVDAFGAQRKRCDQAAAIAEAAGRDHRNLHLVGGHGNQDQPGRVVLAGMAGAFKAVDRNRIDPHALRRQRVADAGAFVHDHDAVLLEFGDVLLRLVARGLDDLDAAFDDGLAIFGVRRRLDRRQDGQVDAERLVGQAAAARDFLVSDPPASAGSAR